MEKISHRSLSVALTLVIFFLATSCAHTAEYEGAKVETLAKSATAYNGQELRYLKTDKPEVTALLVEIPEGGQPDGTSILSRYTPICFPAASP